MTVIYVQKRDNVYVARVNGFVRDRKGDGMDISGHAREGCTVEQAVSFLYETVKDLGFDLEELQQRAPVYVSQAKADTQSTLAQGMIDRLTFLGLMKYFNYNPVFFRLTYKGALARLIEVQFSSGSGLSPGSIGITVRHDGVERRIDSCHTSDLETAFYFLRRFLADG